MRYAAALLLALSAIAQPAGTGAIGGVVIDNATGNPARKIVVTLNWYGSPRCYATEMTNSTGRFVFESLPPGNYTVSARDNMTTAPAQSPSPTPDYIVLAPGERREDVRIAYSRPGSIAGTVLDADGDPLPGQQVRLLTQTAAPTGSRLRMVSGAQTNERGEYKFRNLGRGRYYVVTGGYSRSGFRSPGQPVEFTNVQFYGGATDWKSAAPILVQPGEQLAGVDFRLTTAPGVALRVTVSGLAAEATAASGPGPDSRAPTLELLSAGDMLPYMTVAYRTGPDNRFEFQPALPGRYRLRASYEHDKVLYAAAQEIELTPEHRETTLALAPAVTIKGVVKAETGVALEGRRVSFFRDFGSSGPITATVAKDGSFTVAQVPPGAYTFHVEDLPKGAYGRSVRVGGKDASVEPIEIGLEDPGLIEIAVGAKIPCVEGTIHDDAARKHPVAVLLAPAAARWGLGQLPRIATTGNGGDWKLDAPPGKYKLIAFEPTVESSQLTATDLAARFDRLAIPLEVPERGNCIAVKPTVIHAAEVDEVLR